MLQMPSTILFFLIIMVATLPFAENAPSVIVKPDPKEEELRVRLVFVDNDADEVANSDPQTKYDTVYPTRLNVMKNSASRRSTTFAKSVVNHNDQPYRADAIRSSGLPEMDDERQIWPSSVNTKDLIEDESFYYRPLSLPKTLNKKQSQAKAPVVKQSVNDVTKPSSCDMSVIICCQNQSNLKECFRSQGCPNVTEDMFPNLCNGNYINKVINNVAKYYKADQTK